MLGQGAHLFNGDLALADSHHMPFRDGSFDVLAFVNTFAYYKEPVKVIREAVRVGRYGIVFGIMNRNSPKVLRRRIQQGFGKNEYYVTANFYTPKRLRSEEHTPELQSRGQLVCRLLLETKKANHTIPL